MSDLAEFLLFSVLLLIGGGLAAGALIYQQFSKTGIKAKLQSRQKIEEFTHEAERLEVEFNKFLLKFNSEELSDAIAHFEVKDFKKMLGMIKRLKTKVEQFQLDYARKIKSVIDEAELPINLDSGQIPTATPRVPTVENSRARPWNTFFSSPVRHSIPEEETDEEGYDDEEGDDEEGDESERIASYSGGRRYR